MTSLLKDAYVRQPLVSREREFQYREDDWVLLSKENNYLYHTWEMRSSFDTSLRAILRSTAKNSTRVSDQCWVILSMNQLPIQSNMWLHHGHLHLQITHFFYINIATQCNAACAVARALLSSWHWCELWTLTLVLKWCNIIQWQSVVWNFFMEEWLVSYLHHWL